MDETITTIGIGSTGLVRQSSDLTERCISLHAQLRRSLSDFNYAEAEQLYAELVTVNRLRQEIEELLGRIGGTRVGMPTFLIGATLLFEAFANLMSVPTEAIIYAGGYRYGNIFTVERLVPLELDRSDFGYASADFDFSQKVLVDFEESGNILSCYFHAHPGRGAGSNHPSSIDLANQARLEKGGYVTIGGIFSRDGYLRFFSEKLNYQIVVGGKGVENVGQNQYRLTKV